ncbi:uncharacterized protein LOC141916027 isoform X1 [Strix aluco]|uniref:uncharacterized protein LOC141916027 isoform X1 n=1 Tax=Strix aluco TaxID=111821 RepID=UPI003DA60533
MARRGRMPDHSHLSQLLQVEAPAQHRAVGALGWVQIQGVQLCPPERIAPLPGAQGELKGPVLHPSVTSLHTHFAGKPGVHFSSPPTDSSRSLSLPAPPGHAVLRHPKAARSCKTSWQTQVCSALLLLLSALGGAFLSPPLSGGQGECLLACRDPRGMEPHSAGSEPGSPRGPAPSHSQAGQILMAPLVQCQSRHGAEFQGKYPKIINLNSCQLRVFTMKFR